jgi:putative oxidoreductase
VYQFRTLHEGACLQRLFSTFPDGWPGTGLLVLRIAAGVVLLHHGIVGLPGAHPDEPFTRQLIVAGAGLFLLAGLWTPVAGALVGIIELWIAYSRPADLWTPILLATLGVALAMLGPGAWSIDARLFGRKRIEIRDRESCPLPPQ